MTEPTTPTRWRPRFSVRTLAVLVTLVCCYAACWGPTKTRGIRDVERRVFMVEDGSIDAEIAKGLANLFGPGPCEVSATMPLVVEVDDTAVSTYYFWFFGYVAKLPYERDVVPPLQDLDIQFDHSDFGSDKPAH